ncbi:Protein disulfide isomerase-like 1-4 [Camellia lanceoleosa]|uniref:Protein disulfide isomerase-like 1-4 n=1 Tax=Camellia lanceoleosa TaxID=1840588 RepID=A0ACC0GXL6_9ERIC|nr:Protein disulfide isomerase-like 1-4 [Camellia lanceoleosa]
MVEFYVLLCGHCQALAPEYAAAATATKLKGEMVALAKDIEEVITKIKTTIKTDKTDPNVADAIMELRESFKFMGG